MHGQSAPCLKAVRPDPPIFLNIRCSEYSIPDHPEALCKYSAEMAGSPSVMAVRKSSDHVPDSHCDTDPVLRSVLLPR